MNRLRRAALCLHGLAHRDRAWLLHQLTIDHRSSLEPLLKELSELSAPAEAAQFEFIEEPAPTPTDRENWIRTIDRSEFSAIGMLLAGEPNCLLVTLLAVQDWAWLEIFLDSLPLHRRQEIAEQIAALQGMQPPFLTDAVLETVSGRITEYGSGPGRFENIFDSELSGVLRRRLLRWSESWAR